MYHLDPITREPVYCRYAHSSCPLATYASHYSSISEAVRERLAMSLAVAAAI